MNTIESLLEEIQAAQKTGDRFLEGQANTKIGKLLLERNIYHNAAQYYQRAAFLFGEINRQNHQARALNHLGICLVLLDLPEQALQPLNQAIKLADDEVDLPSGQLPEEI